MNWSAELRREVLGLVRRVGAFALDGWRSADYEIRMKGRIDPVTDIDVAVEQLLRKELSLLTPEVPFVGEESWDQDSMDQGWVVDPIDGTVNFASGLPQFAISIAWMEDGVPMFGAVFAPALGELFWAERGQGAWLNGTPLKVRTGLDISQAVGASGFPYWVREQPRERNNIAAWETLLLKCRALRRGGCASLDLAYTAAGRFSFFWEAGLKPWDVCAGILLVEEAGGVISGYDGGRLKDYFSPIVAAAPDLHNELCDLLSPYDL